MIVMGAFLSIRNEKIFLVISFGNKYLRIENAILDAIY